MPILDRLSSAVNADALRNLTPRIDGERKTNGNSGSFLLGM
jgi:hypothetical protein